MPLYGGAWGGVHLVHATRNRSRNRVADVPRHRVQPEPGWQQRLLSNLNDPESAQIRDVKISKVTGWICGQINSKNKMGGYVGFKAFRISDKE